MQLRDRMKVDWHEMTLQEKKAGKILAFRLTLELFSQAEALRCKFCYNRSVLFRSPLTCELQHGGLRLDHMGLAQKGHQASGRKYSSILQ